MENFCEITFCQQIGSNKRHNQDALFNGEAVFQYKLKTAEKRFENRPHFIVGVADGISNSNRPEKASKLAMQLLRQMESISRQTIYDLQSSLSAELAEDYFGSATTFVAAEIDQTTHKAKILSVGDSRAYLIDAQDKWLQITQDHSILSELLADFPDKKEEDFALMNPLMILVKIIKLRWIHILSYDQMVSRKINNQTTRCANSIFYTTLFTNSAPNYT